MLPLITRLVNLTLLTVNFPISWKKIGMAVEMKSYRTVKNLALTRLSFTSHHEIGVCKCTICWTFGQKKHFGLEGHCICIKVISHKRRFYRHSENEQFYMYKCKMYQVRDQSLDPPSFRARENYKIVHILLT